MVEYIEDNELAEAVKELLDDLSIHEFGSIRDAETTIVTLLKVKTEKESGELQRCGAPYEIKKVPDLYKGFVESQYILLVDKYAWDGVDGDSRRALLHKTLMSISAEKKDDGTYKLGKRKPEIVEHIETVARFGNYNKSLQTLADILVYGAKNAANKILAEKA